MDKPQSWLEIVVTCDGELAEAISEVLARFVTQGVVTETEVKYDDAEEVALGYGPVKVIGYLEYDDQVESKKLQIEEALWHLNLIQPVPEPVYRKIEDQNWMESWKQFYKPILIGEKLLILPAWLENPVPERIAVRIDPSMAFGTGTHPTTQLCMSMVEKLIKPNSLAMDIGCGSGILAISSALLGAKKVIAVDIDDPSKDATQKNAELNKVSEKIEIGIGSVSEILEGQFSFKSAPVVMVNILAPIIIRLFSNGLYDLVSENGTLVLSGILDRQADEVQKTAEKYGLKIIEKRTINDWVGMTFLKN
ncbi:MAG: 50S ribosomal protein L11 methyltransferase [Chloroflexi bacterium HGW-Chloroflexi-8]|nr:MAG: 50S ribosomal protein L11 methyltransferase [Chloroflexi bacterium HGW-Chloroflexi-8]